MSDKSLSASERARIEERRVCVRTLLQQPMLLHEGKNLETMRLVRRHAEWLREWFLKYPAWHLQVESDFARLVKFPGPDADGSRALRDPKNGLQFTRGRYVYFCLILAVIERRNERQTVLGDLAAEMARLGRGDPVLEEAGVTFTFDRRESRQDLVSAVRVLIDLGVLRRMDGNEDQYLQNSGDVLYTIHRPVLAHLLSVRRGPSTVKAVDWESRLVKVREEEVPESDEARRVTLRSSLYRRLLDSPVLYYQDLNEEERAYLQSQRTFMLRNIQEATGLVPEVRAEGIAMVDPQRQLTDHPMPEEGTEGHAALLIAEELCRHLRETPEVPVPQTRLEQFLVQCAKKHGQRWRKDAREPAGQKQLLLKVLDRLAALDLIRREDHSVFPLPALARYRLEVKE